MEEHKGKGGYVLLYRGFSFRWASQWALWPSVFKHANSLTCLLSSLLSQCFTLEERQINYSNLLLLMYIRQKPSTRKTYFTQTCIQFYTISQARQPWGFHAFNSCDECFQWALTFSHQQTICSLLFSNKELWWKQSLYRMNQLQKMLAVKT